MEGNKGFSNLINNWKVVMFSFLGATTFWLFRSLSQDQSALISYPIEFVFDEDSVVVMDPLPETVKIDVSSGGWNLFRRTLLFSVEPLKVELDNPSEIKFLNRSFLMPIITEQLKGLEINYLVSDTLTINIQRKIAKPVRLRVDSVNLPLASRYRLTSSISIDPPVIDLIGPENIISSFESEYYIMPDISRVNSDIDEEVEIPLPFTTIMSSNPRNVQVSFAVDRFERGQIQIPLEIMNYPENPEFELSDTAVIVNYTFQQSLGDDFDTTDFGITLDFNMLNLDSTIAPILIYHPESVSDVEFSPAVIDLIYSNE